MDSIDSPAAGRGSLKLDLKQTSAEKEEADLEWILFDVNFGIPLFDADLNRKVGHRVQGSVHT